MLTLGTIVHDFAAAFLAVDAERPVAGRFRPGLGPHNEDKAVGLVLKAMQASHPDRYRHAGQQLPYPNSAEKCDFWIGDPVEWAIEIKMARFYYDKDPPTHDPASVKDVLSPFRAHRSAVTDTAKLADSALAPHKAVLIYGFEYPDLPLHDVIDAFELLARARVELGERISAPLRTLVHPIHNTGAVFAWEVLSRR